MNKSILGLDIQEKVVSAVIIKSGLKGSWIDFEASFSISSNLPETEGLAGCLKEISAGMDPAGCLCAVGFPSHEVFFRNLQVPFKETRKIRQILPFELEAHLPLPIDELDIDFHSVKSADHNRIIAAAIEKSRLQSFLEPIRNAGIEPEIITPRAYAMVRCLMHLGNLPQNCLILCTDAAHGVLALISSAQLVVLRSFALPFESDRTVAIRRSILQALSAFEETAAEEAVCEKIYWCGGGSDSADNLVPLSDAMGCPVVRVNLFQDIDHRLGRSQTGPWQSPQMDYAFALALTAHYRFEGISFRRSTLKKRWAEHKNSLIQTGVLAGVVLLLSGINIFMDLHGLERRMTLLDSRIHAQFASTFPEVTRIVDPLQQMQQKINEIRSRYALPQSGENPVRHLDMLNEISTRIPLSADVELTSFVSGSDGVVVSGNTDTFNAVDEIKNRLEKGEMFKTVTITAADMDRTSNRVQFNLKLQF